MQENVLLNVIREAYAKETGEEFGSASRVVDAFCEFADKWLREKGVVGLGQTTDGFAIRFADGTELLLADNTSPLMDTGAPVSITGQASRKQNIMPDTTRSFNITGR